MSKSSIFFGFDEETARQEHSVLFQHLLDYVKPERDQNARESNPRIWWRFGWERPVLRKQIQGLKRFHRYDRNREAPVFCLPGLAVLPDNMLTTIAWMTPFSSASCRAASREMVAVGRRSPGGRQRPSLYESRCFDRFHSQYARILIKPASRRLRSNLMLTANARAQYPYACSHGHL